MEDSSSSTADNKKKVGVSATDINKVIPKLATRVFLGKAGANTLLTFVADLGDGKLHAIETIAMDATLHEGLLRLLQKELKEREGKK